MDSGPPDDRTYYLEQLNNRLKSLGFEPGDLQWKYRTEKDLPYDPTMVDLAILDALVNMGGATAWTGDGSSCAAQIVENFAKQRDKYKALAWTFGLEAGWTNDEIEDALNG